MPFYEFLEIGLFDSPVLAELIGLELPGMYPAVNSPVVDL
jgi:hypothetical protein